MNKKPNRKRQAGTAADSDTQPKLTTSSPNIAKRFVEPNPAKPGNFCNLSIIYKEF